jgi:hypothetical protein
MVFDLESFFRHLNGVLRLLVTVKLLSGVLQADFRYTMAPKLKGVAFVERFFLIENKSSVTDSLQVVCLCSLFNSVPLNLNALIK